jgi:hypothetical protein
MDCMTVPGQVSGRRKKLRKCSSALEARAATRDEVGFSRLQKIVALEQQHTGSRAACLAGNPPSLAETEEKKNTHEASHLGPKLSPFSFCFCCAGGLALDASRTRQSVTLARATELVRSGYKGAGQSALREE